MEDERPIRPKFSKCLHHRERLILDFARGLCKAKGYDLIRPELTQKDCYKAILPEKKAELRRLKAGLNPFVLEASIQKQLRKIIELRRALK